MTAFSHDSLSFSVHVKIANRIAS